MSADDPNRLSSPTHVKHSRPRGDEDNICDGNRRSEVYRPGFSGHKILLCGRPYWAECGEPFAPGLSRAAVGILLQQPVLVIARDEGPDRGANLLGIAEDPAPHDLLLEGADEPLRHTVGLGLADEGKARRHAEEGDL